MEQSHQNKGSSTVFFSKKAVIGPNFECLFVFENCTKIYSIFSYLKT